MADAEGLRDGPFIPSRADAMSRAVAAPLLPSLGKRREVLENKTSSLFNVSEFSLLQSERRRGFFFFLEWLCILVGGGSLLCQSRFWGKICYFSADISVFPDTADSSSHPPARDTTGLPPV